MKRQISLALCGALFLLGATLAATATDKSKPAAKAPAPAPPPPVMQIPESVFVIPASPREGRNPFFPQSMTEVVPVVKAAPKGPDLNTIVLNGISSPPRPTAMVNGRTFEQGEAGEIKLPGGHRVMLQCVEIGKDSVVIQVDNQRRELRLRAGI